MNGYTGVKKEGRGYYVAWINGEIAGSASNPAAAQVKFDKELDRHAVNAEREVTNAIWEAKKYSKSQAQLESLCPDFYSM